MVYHPNIDLEGNVCLNILRWATNPPGVATNFFKVATNPLEVATAPVSPIFSLFGGKKGQIVPPPGPHGSQGG